MIPSLKIVMICPAPPGSRKGNRVTALRWARLLKQLGHRVAIQQSYEGTRCDLMIALHARRSAKSIETAAREVPPQPIVLALTGTDLYHDIRTSRQAQRSLELATRIVVLQPRGRDELSAAQRVKTWSILQSAEPIPNKALRRRREAIHAFRVCVVGHMRYEKDPRRAAMASRLLPAHSRAQIIQVGAALDPALKRWAAAESRRNPRFRWVGEVSYGRARRILAASDLLVLSSRLEGGANVLSEAIVDSVPIVASDIPSTRGILGDDYPGLYPVGDTRRLAELLNRAESDRAYYRQLRESCRRLRPLFAPTRERESWRALIAQLSSR